MNPCQSRLHERALSIALAYRKAECDLLDILQQIDQEKVFRVLGFKSLFDYAVEALGLSEASAYNFISVARKAIEIPEIKSEIRSGALSVSKVRKIMPVIQKTNALEWLEKAKTLPKRKLEKAVAKVAPKVLTPEKASYVTEKRMKLELGVSEAFYQEILRVKDILSQKYKRSVSTEEAFQACVGMFLDRSDPVRKAKRVLDKKNNKQATKKLAVPGQPTNSNKTNRPFISKQRSKGESSRRKAISARLKHQVYARSGGKCQHVNSRGLRCNSMRWLEMHHIKPVALGGDDQLSNLQLLCFHHHRGKHDGG